ncbi:hypothetical protein, partial [Streptomyces griseus]|uniref:hypothetical protein n=1 Tax=Streptomyces griseus TaxID=1911 RepID=UPI001C5A56E5
GQGSGAAVECASVRVAVLPDEAVPDAPAWTRTTSSRSTTDTAGTTGTAGWIGPASAMSGAAETAGEVSGERAHRAGVNGVARRGRYGSSRSARLRR